MRTYSRSSGIPSYMIDPTDQRSCLNNSYICYINHKNILYRSVEHYFHSYKAVRLEDFLIIIEEPDPSKLRKIGEGIKIRKDWKEIREKVMWHGLNLKYLDPNMRWHLLQTKDKDLNYPDDHWSGNIIGRMLMKIRKNLIDQKR